MSKQLLEDLIASKALIDSPVKWIQYELAVDSEGNRVGVVSSDATCFCSMGAFVHYLHDKPGAAGRDRAVVRALDDASVLVSFNADMNIVCYNDTHSHDEVMAVWDRAIAEAATN